MMNRIRRTDPLVKVNQKGDGLSGEVPALDTTANLTSSILDPILAGKALLDRIDEYYSEPAGDAFQDLWSRFRLTMIAAKALPGVEFAALNLPVPYLEMVDQLFLQNLVIRLVSILDEKLDEVIDVREIPIKSRPKLKDMIYAVHDAGLVTNSAELHSLRSIRNEIGHKVNPKNIEWADVFSVADQVEHALLELGLATSSPNFKVEPIVFTALKPSERQYELGCREVVLTISADGLPYCSFKMALRLFHGPKMETIGQIRS